MRVKVACIGSSGSVRDIDGLQGNGVPGPEKALAGPAESSWRRRSGPPWCLSPASGLRDRRRKAAMGSAHRSCRPRDGSNSRRAEQGCRIGGRAWRGRHRTGRDLAPDGEAVFARPTRTVRIVSRTSPSSVKRKATACAIWTLAACKASRSNGSWVGGWPCTESSASNPEEAAAATMRTGAS